MRLVVADTLCSAPRAGISEDKMFFIKHDLPRLLDRADDTQRKCEISVARFDLPQRLSRSALLRRPAAVYGKIGASDRFCRIGAKINGEIGDLLDSDEFLCRLRR